LSTKIIIAVTAERMWSMSVPKRRRETKRLAATVSKILRLSDEVITLSGRLGPHCADPRFPQEVRQGCHRTALRAMTKVATEAVDMLNRAKAPRTSGAYIRSLRVYLAEPTVAQLKEGLEIMRANARANGVVHA